MDTNFKIPCKITIFNESGEVILDTLINQSDEEGKPRRLQRMVAIHGITDEQLIDAPTFKEVREHLRYLLDPSKIIIIGHSIKQDLIVMELSGFNFIDTSLIIDHRQPNSLKDCLFVLLNAHIQEEGKTHSSIIDARGTLALFHFFMKEP